MIKAMVDLKVDIFRPLFWNSVLSLLQGRIQNFTDGGRQLQIVLGRQPII